MIVFDRIMAKFCMCAVDYMLIRQIAVIYSTPGRNPISDAAYTLVDPPPSFRPIRCLYVGLIKPNSDPASLSVYCQYVSPAIS